MAKVKRKSNQEEKTYSYNGRAFSVPAQVVGEELAKIEKANGGIEPEEVVRLASDPKHALHPLFEWDDTEAARAYRIHQAKTVIRSVKIQYIGESGVKLYTPSYISVYPQKTTDDPGPRMYVNSVRVMNSEDLLAQAMADAKIQLQGFVNRYERIKELGRATSKVREALEEL